VGCDHWVACDSIASATDRRLREPLHVLDHVPFIGDKPGDKEEAGIYPQHQQPPLDGKGGQMEGLTCRAHPGGDTIVISVRGQLDLATSEDLTTAVFPWLTPGAHVVLECSGLPFMDSSGLKALLALRNFADNVHARLALAAVPHSITGILQLAGVEELFSIEQINRNCT
jgi:anti-sigma B factor antagonist